MSAAAGGRRAAWLRPLWVPGLACLVIFATDALTSRTERHEWTAYLALGTLFPALVVAASLCEGRFPRATRALRMLSIGVCLVAFALVVRGRLTPWLFGVATTHWAAGVLVFALIVGRAPAPAMAAVGLLVTLVGWSLATSFVWWTKSPTATFEALVAGSWYALALLIVMAGLVTAVLRTPPDATQRRTISDVLAVILIALASVRAIPLFNEAAFHHWGAIVGAAALVRDGGWLLYDVPSQYGFLSTLSIVAMPAASVWQAFYVLHSVLAFLSGLLLYSLLRAVNGRRPTLLVALLLTLAAVFVLPGWPVATGTPATPAAGPFRFVWCYALIGLLFWASRTDRRLPTVLATGSVLWVLGTLWSVESAACCLGVWGPAWAALITRRAVAAETGRSAALGVVARATLLPALLLLGSVVAVAAFYRGLFGQLPDWSAFTDYGGTSLEYFSLPIDPAGGVGLLLLALAAVATVTAEEIRRAPAARLALLSGTWGLVWACSSYFVVRSHEANITNLSPVLCIAVAVVLGQLVRRPPDDPTREVLVAGLGPLLIVMLTSAFAVPQRIVGYLSSLPMGYTAAIESRLPSADASVTNLIADVVGQADPIVFIDGDDGMSLLPPLEGVGFPSLPRAWLPALPLIILDPLPEQRRRVHVDRFVRRRPLAGWLIESKTRTNHRKIRPVDETWLFDQIARTHRPTRVEENEEWRATWFEPLVAPALR